MNLRETRACNCMCKVRFLTAIEIRSMRSNELWIDLYFFFLSYYFKK